MAAESDQTLYVRELEAKVAIFERLLTQVAREDEMATAARAAGVRSSLSHGSSSGRSIVTEVVPAPPLPRLSTPKATPAPAPAAAAAATAASGAAPFFAVSAMLGGSASPAVTPIPGSSTVSDSGPSAHRVADEGAPPPAPRARSGADNSSGSSMLPPLHTALNLRSVGGMDATPQPPHAGDSSSDVSRSLPNAGNLSGRVASAPHALEASDHTYGSMLSTALRRMHPDLRRIVHKCGAARFLLSNRLVDPSLLRLEDEGGKVLSTSHAAQSLVRASSGSGGSGVTPRAAAGPRHDAQLSIPWLEVSTVVGPSYIDLLDALRDTCAADRGLAGMLDEMIEVASELATDSSASISPTFIPERLLSAFSYDPVQDRPFLPCIHDLHVANGLPYEAVRQDAIAAYAQSANTTFSVLTGAMHPAASLRGGVLEPSSPGFVQTHASDGRKEGAYADLARAMLTCVASPAEVHTFLLSEEDAYDKSKGGSSKFAKHRSVSVLRSFQAACDGRPAVGSSLYGMAATVRAPLTRSLLAQRLQAAGVRPEILSACVGNILTDNEAVVYPLTFMIMSRYPHFAAMEQLLQGMVAQWRVSLEADIRASRTFHNELVQQQAEGGGTTWSSPRVPDKSEATAEAERALPNPSREGALHVGTGTSGKDHTTLEETMQVLQYASVCLAKLRFVHNDLVATRLQFASRQALLTGVQRERYFFRVDELTSAWRHGSLLLNDVRTRALSLCTTLIESSLPLAAFHPALACLLQQSLAVDMPSFGGSKILECVCNAPPTGGALVDTSRTARGEGDLVAPKVAAPRGSAPAQPTMEAVTDALAGAPDSGITTPSSLRIFIQRPRAALGNERATSLIEQLMEEHGAVNVSELLPLLTIVRCFVDTLAPYDVAAPEYTALLQACEMGAVEAPLLGCDMRHYETATCAARYALPHVLTLLPPATMVQVLASLLTEQSVVFVCGHSMPLAAATHCVLACMAMLHPLVWEQNIRPTVHNGLMSDIASLGLDALAQANVIGVQDIGELPQAAEHMPLDVCVVLLSEGGRMLIHPDTASKLQLPGAAQLTRELTSVLTAEGVTIPQQPALVASRAPAPEPVPAPPAPSATATMPRTTTVAATSTLGGEVLAVHGARDGAVAEGGQRQQESSAAVARERAHTPASTSRSRGRARVHKPTTSGFELALSPTRGGVGALGAAASAAACRAAEQCVPLLYRHVCVLLGHALAAALSMEACEHAGASRTHIQQAVPVQFLPSARGTRVVHSLLPDFWVRFTSSMAWTQHTTVCTHRAMMAAMSNTAPSYSHIGFHYTFETVRSVVHHRVAYPGQAIPAPIFPTSPAKLAVVAPGVELARS